MKSIIRTGLLCILVSSVCPSCSSIFRSFINKKYPPVSSLEKSAASTQAELLALQNLPKAGVGIQLNRELLDTLIKTYFLSKLAKDTTLGIKNAGQIHFIIPPTFTLEQQEIIVSTSIQIADVQNKYLKEVDFTMNGRISPSVQGDSIMLAPSFSQIHVEQLKLRKWIILGGLAKRVVNGILQNYMDNVNGALKSFAVEVRYPPIPSQPLSKLLGTDDNLKVLTDDTFHLKPRKLNPVVLVDTGHIGVLADVVINNTAPPNIVPVPRAQYVVNSSLGTGSQIINLNQLDPSIITPAQFKLLFHKFDSLYKSTWNLYLDTLTITTPSQGEVCLSYATLSEMINELWAKANFSLSYQLSYKTDFPMEEIKLAEISQPDCGIIQFPFQALDCSKVLSDCGSCQWWNAICHAGWLVCQTANGVKYAGCQSANAAKLAAATVEFTAQKALCYSEVAGVFILNNLVLSVGYFKGSAGVDGLVTGTLIQTKPGGIESLGLVANVAADGKADASLLFIPKGVGLLVCSLPAAVIIHNKNVRVDAPAFAVNATTEKITQSDQCILRVHTGDLSIPIQLGQPLLVDILQQPGLVLSCPVGVFLGTAIASVLDLTHNQHFKNYLDAIFRGTYNWSFHKDLNVPLPAIPVSSSQTKFKLLPSWGKNSIIYTKN